MLLNLTISAQKYPKIVMHVKQIHVQTVILKTTEGFFMAFWRCFYMFKCRNQTYDQNQKCSLVKLEQEMLC